MPRVTGCPRCGSRLRAPGLWSSDWQCPEHGPVLPFTRFHKPSVAALEDVRRRCAVPLWMFSPVPPAWRVTGLGYAGDDRDLARAGLLACSGPGPLGGHADVLLVAEDPGIGLGARFAGLAGPDPGAGFDSGPPDAKIEAAGHPTALWSLGGCDSRAAFVGEAKGRWLWVIVYPDRAGVLLYDNLVLRDLREGFAEAGLEFGPPTPVLDTA